MPERLQQYIDYITPGVKRQISSGLFLPGTGVEHMPNMLLYPLSTTLELVRGQGIYLDSAQFLGFHNMINLISITLLPACLTEVNPSTTLMVYEIDGATCSLLLNPKQLKQQLCLSQERFATSSWFLIHLHKTSTTSTARWTAQSTSLCRVFQRLITTSTTSHLQSVQG